MFPWDFARSAEAMFSRWAFKRLCKFILKKRLGDLILGDIDLDQLDVQLSRGTIQLTDLALNVDFLNQKLVGAPVMVKEGSIASLSVKIPWKLQNCQIEVEELELVLAPFVEKNSPRDADCCISNGDDKDHICIDSGKIDPETAPSSSASISLNVHEGVKTIARMVKWFLTSFHVRLKDLIIAFDPSSVNEKGQASRSFLVLRIAETEYGTCVSEDAATISKPKPDGLLGMAKLTNFVNFKGAIIEFLQMVDVDNQPQVHCDLGTSFSEWYAGNSSFGSTSAILTGKSGGFSGKLNLSIPWKNGSLDIRKVDADVFVEPVIVRIQPITIEWVIDVWELLKNVGKAGKNSDDFKRSLDSVLPNSRFHDQPSMCSTILDSDIVISRKGNLSKSTCTVIDQETFEDTLPPRTQLIHNWVPLYITEEDRTALEPDYGESIDQFFECFDGIRSSHASSGNSSMWNWTCSVFSAITVASNLASGSGQFPIEQHAETSLRASIAEVFVVLSFRDEEHKCSHDLMDRDNHIKDQGTNHGCSSACNVYYSSFDDQSSESYMSCLSSMNIEQSTTNEVYPTSVDIHKLEASSQDVVLNLQISPKKMKVEVSVAHVKVDECQDRRNWAGEFGFIGYKNNSSNRMILNKYLQEQVQGVLPPFSFSSQKQYFETSDVENARRTIHSTVSHDGLVRVRLLESSGVCTFHYAASSTDLDGRSMTSTSFSVHLPPLVLWVHFHLVNMLLILCKQVENYLEKSDLTKGFSSNVTGESYKSSSPDDVGSGASTFMTSVSPGTNLRGNIVLHQTRVIVCFPSESHGNLRNSTSLEKFIILEHSPLGLTKVSDDFPISKATFPKGHSCAPSTSIHLNAGKFDIYLVDSAKRDCFGGKICKLDTQSFSAVKILSVASRINDSPAVTMLWQKGPVTGPWIATRAWRLATSHDQSRYKATREGYEVCPVTTAEKVEHSAQLRQDLILSSAFFLHVCFSLVQFNLSSNDYKLLNHLLDQVVNVFSNRAHDSNPTSDESVKNVKSPPGDSHASQASVLVDCDALDLCIVLDDEAVKVSCSIQKELPGSWNCIKLKIEKLEVLSVSNMGGISNANFVWLNHGEGELWGSIVDRNEKASAASQDFLLVTCKDSAIRRGSGEGANALSFGSAGTAITCIWNPQLLQSYTSIVVQCGTIIAHGGRLDWIDSICLFFSLPREEEESINDVIERKSSEVISAYEASFFLDLVDIALSYEPYMKCLTEFGQDPDAEDRSVEEACKQFVSCLLAAEAISLSNLTRACSATISYNVKLQDLGLLISESSGSENDPGGYHVGYLQKAGYVKVANDSLVEAVVRIEGVHWEIECSDSHINLNTCHDTTHGLIRLAGQLQQIYAPDVEDALAHLQSRWSSLQQAPNEDSTNDAAKTFSSGSVGSSSEEMLASEEDFRSVGLLDEILENAFYMNGEIKPNDHCGPKFHCQEGRGISGDSYNLNTRTSSVNENFARRIPLEESMYSSGMGRVQQSCERKTCSPEIIESYYVSKILSPSNLTADDHSPVVNNKCSFSVTDQREIEYGKSGWYNDGSLVIVENHISKVLNQPGSEKLNQECNFASVSSKSVDDNRQKGRILLKDIDLRWRMCAGLDWSKPSQDSMASSNRNGRDGNICLDLILSGLDLQYDLYPAEEIIVSKLSVSIEDIHLYDRSRDAPWTMVLGYYRLKDHRRESCAKAFKLELDTVRPDPVTPLEDYRLFLEFLPLRLHLDQGQLNFLISFFGMDSSTEDSPTLPNNLGGSEISHRKRTFGSQSIVEEALLPFFQKCEVKPVFLRVDYIPRHVDLAALRRGIYVELLNLVPWKGIDLQLKHVYAVGVYGWSSVCETVVGEWLEDISHNQVHKLLQGLAPIRSLFAVSSGASKLVSFPIKSYKKDHKLLKGIQRGASAFIKSISLEAVGVGMHLAAGAHEILVQTEYILTSIPPSVPSSEKNRRKVSRPVQPEDAQQGIQQAYERLGDGFSRSASALLGTPMKAYQRGASVGSAFATAVRAVPTAAIAPVSASARALHCALLGVRNSLDPERKRESMEKYLGPSPS